MTKKNEEIKFLSKDWFISNLKTIFYAILIALLIRTFLFQPFFIPSSSMGPTLLVGDRIFVSKYSYGYSKHSFPFSPPILSKRILFSEPQRGDVLVFKTPDERKIDYIKRLIGLPGDTIQMIEGDLFINEKVVKKEKIRNDQKILRNGRVAEIGVFLETLENDKSYETYSYYDDGPADNTPKIVVPDGHYYMLGDNRDNSKDSRFIGSIPINNFVGRAEIIFFATKDGSTILEFWKWPFGIQYKRLLSFIN